MMNVKTLSVLVLSSLFLVGCSFSNVKPLSVQNIGAERPKLSTPELPIIKLQEPKWIIVTPENVDQVFKDLEEKKYSLALVAITDDGYENISINTAKLLARIIEQRKIIALYKNYYEPQKD